MDFEPISALEHAGFRLASVDVIERGASSGDALLIGPDGRAIDVWWQSERRSATARWAPPPSASGTGVIAVEITGKVDSERELGPVLEAASLLLEPTPGAGGEPHP